VTDIQTPPGGDLLATIVAATKRVVEVREAAEPARSLACRITRAPQREAFVAALASRSGLRVIAECKRRSPSRGILREVYEAAAHARAYASAGAAAISVLTEPTFFDGSLDDLERVRGAVAVPVLRKDFIVSEYQLLEAAVCGADAVLLIVAALDDASLRALLVASRALGLEPLVEVHDAAEAQRAVDAGARVIGVNSRNLRTLTVDPGTHERIVGLLPPDVIRVAESGLRRRQDLERLSAAGYDAFLVGERLMAQPDPGAALRELVGA
jgi:indole-3-glycerol phosphate synthase